MFGLVDCNNFYASCERVFRPDLRNKPIVVLSNNDGCVIARSNEAKKLGIPMGAPAFQYQELFNENNVNVFSSNFALYGDMSSRVMNILTEFAPEIEIYSIDEAFLKYEGSELIDFEAHGMDIRKTVVKHTGIPISVGFAPNKVLSKVANKIAKKFPERTNGVYIIDTEEKRNKALKWLPIEDVWGIGRKLTKKLNNINIKNAFEFTQLSDDWVKKNMSVVGLRLKHELEGKLSLDLDDLKSKKEIATTRSFDSNFTNFEEINERVVTFAVTCAAKLRKQKSCCNALMVFVHTNGFRKDLPQYSKNIVINLPYPTNSSIEIAKFASKALKYIFKDGYAYKKAGVIVMDFTPEETSQITLFENSNPKHKSLMNVMDKLNKTIGYQKVKLASQDIGRTWKMEQEKLSPRYTTKLNEIIIIESG